MPAIPLFLKAAFFKAALYHWKVSVLVILFTPLLLGLGFWQLERAEQKRQLLAVYQQQQELPPIPLADLVIDQGASNNKSQADTYRPVTLTGRYNNSEYWLLDNRSRGGKPGYEIVMPFTSDVGTILINRGWLPAPQRRDQLPAVETPTQQLTINGFLYPLPSNAIIKHSDSDWPEPWPKRVLQLDTQAVSAALDTSVYPLLLNIDSDSPGALITEWQVTNTLPQKHQGYAVQWFTMAIALLIFYSVFLIKTRPAELTPS